MKFYDEVQWVLLAVLNSCLNMAIYVINKAVNTSNSKKTWSAAYISSARPRAEHTVNMYRKTLKETSEPTLHSSSLQQPTLHVTPRSSSYSPQRIIAVLQPTWSVQEFSTKVALSFFLKTLIHCLSFPSPQSLKYLPLLLSRVLFLQSSSVPLHV